MKNSLAVIVPAYNEGRTIKGLLELVLSNDLVGQVIVVDDASEDDTHRLVSELCDSDKRVLVLKHEVNRGKGACVRTAVDHVTMPYSIIQDADFEYSPHQYAKLIAPLHEGECEVCYGSRYLKHDSRRVLKFWHTMGNLFLTTLSNMFSNLYVTDMETCYKAFKTEVLRKIDIEEERFGVEPEITAKVAKLGVRVCEVAIAYNPRTKCEGKHIGLLDGFSAIWCILKYNLRN